MMQLAEGLKDRVWQQVEGMADPNAVPKLRAALATVADPQHQDAIFTAATTLASAWADAALLVGWQMATDPGAWLFAGEEERRAIPKRQALGGRVLDNLKILRLSKTRSQTRAKTARIVLNCNRTFVFYVERWYNRYRKLNSQAAQMRTISELRTESMDLMDLMELPW